MRQFLRRWPAFTVIEIITTMLLIGIIASLGIIGTTKLRQQSQDSTFMNEVSNVQTALNLYKQDHGFYPQTITPGQPLIGSGGKTYLTAAPSQNGKLPNCPTADYSYQLENNGSSYKYTYCLNQSNNKHCSGQPTYMATPAGISLAGICGDSCCANGQVCTSGKCCTPNCSNKCGGSDGCGGTCYNQACTAGRTCYQDNCCLPNCSGKCGGSDGCGGTCANSCIAGQECSGDVCVADLGYTSTHTTTFPANLAASYSPGLAMSSDGNKIYVTDYGLEGFNMLDSSIFSPIFYSINGGSTWSSRSTGILNKNVDTDDSGTYVAVTGYIGTGSDIRLNNNITNSSFFSLGLPSAGLSWGSIALNGNGSKLFLLAEKSNTDIVTTESRLYYNNRNGSSWGAWFSKSPERYLSYAGAPLCAASAASDYVLAANAHSSGGDITFFRIFSNFQVSTTSPWNSVYSNSSIVHTSCSLSSSAAKKAVGTSNNYIYVDSGSGFAAKTASGSRAWKSVAYSPNGSHLAAAVSNGNLYLSTDDGASFSTLTAAGSRAWTSVACSDSCSKIAAVTSWGPVYISNDTGTNWSSVYPNIRPQSFFGAGLSADGGKLLLLTRHGLHYNATGGSGSWSNITTTASTKWPLNHANYDITQNNAVMSDDGQYIGAVFGGTNAFAFSNDGGTTFGYKKAGLGMVGAVGGPHGLDMSDNGNIIVYMDSDGSNITKYTVCSNIWTSPSCATAVQPQSVYPKGLPAKWTKVDMSGDGRVIALGDNGGVYFHGTGGQNTAENSLMKDLPDIVWQDVDSPDGDKVVIAGNGYIYKSPNRGSNWSATNAPALDWQFVAMADDGLTIVAAPVSGYIHSSRDGGYTWNQETALGSRTWSKIVLSDNGQKLMAAYTNGTSGGGVLVTPQ